MSIHHLNIKKILFAIFFLGNSSFCLLQEPHNNYKETFHPSYDVIDIQPTGFEAKISGMAFLSDGRMVISTRYQGVNGAPQVGRENGMGDIIILGNVVNGNPQTITRTPIATGLDEPLGLVVVGDIIYSIDRTGLFKFDLQGNKTLLGPATSGSGHPFAFGLAYHDGFFYGGYGGHTADMSIRGDGFKISLDGQRTNFGLGLRHTNGWTALPTGEIFTTDQQGPFNPANKLMHIRENAFQGFYPVGRDIGTQTEVQPVVYLPEGTSAGSPSQPLYIDSGIYAGQMFVGEIRYPNFHRVFIEKVNGEWQGSLFSHAGGLICGVNKLAWGPDGHLYLGQLGQVQGNPSWSFKDNYTNPTQHPTNNDDAAMARIQEVEFGLKRVVPNGKKTFEMLAVRAIKNGFDIEFTDQLEVGAANPSKFIVEQWRYEKGNSQYGGVPFDSTELTIDSVGVLADNKTVRLRISGLKTKHVVHIKLQNLKSASGEDSWNQWTWYTLNNLGIDPPTSISRGKRPANRNWIKNLSDGYQLKAPIGPSYEVRLYSITGQLLSKATEVQSEEIVFKKLSLNPGLYFIKIEGNAIRSTESISILR